MKLTIANAVSLKYSNVYKQSVNSINLVSKFLKYCLSLKLDHGFRRGRNPVVCFLKFLFVYHISCALVILFSAKTNSKFAWSVQKYPKSISIGRVLWVRIKWIFCWIYSQFIFYCLVQSSTLTLQLLAKDFI